MLLLRKKENKNANAYTRKGNWNQDRGMEGGEETLRARVCV